MRCPRCRKQHDILRYVPMGVIEEYATETNPIYKCPGCRWVFSPALTATELQNLISMLNSANSNQTSKGEQR